MISGVRGSFVRREISGMTPSPTSTTDDDVDCSFLTLPPVRRRKFLTDQRKRKKEREKVETDVRRVWAHLPDGADISCARN